MLKPIKFLRKKNVKGRHGKPAEGRESQEQAHESEIHESSYSGVP